MDHKRIGLLYLLSITLFFFVGGLAARCIRLDLLTPAGDLVQTDTYNKLFTLHGIVMIFFFLIPSIPAVLGNFLLPLMLGARDLAFPRLNLLSWYIFIIGGAVHAVRHRRRRRRHRLDVLHALQQHLQQYHVVATAVGIFIAGFSSILTGLNFIVTIHKMRAPGMHLVPPAAVRLVDVRHQHHPVLGTPVLAIAICLVAVERLLQIGIFDPELGGDPVLFQHLFWFYSHPAVYIMILPGMGVVSEVIPCFCPQAHLRLRLHRLFQLGHRGASAFWSGGTTCSSPGSRSMPAWCSRS